MNTLPSRVLAKENWAVNSCPAFYQLTPRVSHRNVSQNLKHALMRNLSLTIVLVLLMGTLTLADTLSGTWVFKTTIDATAAGDGIKEQELEVQIQQTGDQVVFSFGSARLTGKLVGDKLTVRGSYEEEGTITKNLSFTVKDDEMTGGGEWTYSDGEGYKVKGTEKLEGVKLDG